MIILHPENSESSEVMLPELIAPFGPLTIKEEFKKNKVHLVHYADRNIRPHNLGVWPAGSRFNDTFPPQPSKWHIAPPPDQPLVLKCDNFTDAMEDERGIMMSASSIFPEGSKVRLPYLYGYGSINSARYLLQEYIEPSFRPLNQYIDDKQQIPVEEAFEIGILIADLLTQMHVHGMTHGDMCGYFPDEASGMGHVLWNPDTKEMRIIDWGEGRSHRHINLEYKDGLYMHDHIGIRSTLRMLLGTTSQGADIKDMVPVLTRYAKNGYGTAQLAEDLRDLSVKLGFSI
ncbi:MAG: hypothetical protein ACEQSA_01895 [Weeksellaceae bacterium]